MCGFDLGNVRAAAQPVSQQCHVLCLCCCYQLEVIRNTLHWFFPRTLCFFSSWYQIFCRYLEPNQNSSTRWSTALPHSYFCVISSKFLVFSIIMLQWLPCGKFPTRIGTSAFRFTLLHMGGNEHHFREHLGTLLDGCSPSRYLLWCKACISLITFPSISVSTLECIFQLQHQWFIQPKEAVQLQLGYCDG